MSDSNKISFFDAHFHIIDYQFPIKENNGFRPSEFTISQYQDAVDQYDVLGGAIVSGSFQEWDQSYLYHSLDALGDSFVGVANIPHDLPDDKLEKLDKHNIVAVRFNLKRGGSASLEHMEYLSNKLFEKYGWHTELYVDSKDLKQIRNTLKKIKLFSIDHLGLSKDGLKDLFYWVEKGAKVKATGFGRLDIDPIPVMKEIHAINPKALMFGTDLPSTRSKTPFSHLDIMKITNNFDLEDQKRIFYSNAMEWYQKKQ